MLRDKVGFNDALGRWGRSICVRWHCLLFYPFAHLTHWSRLPMHHLPRCEYYMCPGLLYVACGRCFWQLAGSASGEAMAQEALPNYVWTYVVSGVDLHS